jgi:hypothetical protein
MRPVICVWRDVLIAERSATLSATFFDGVTMPEPNYASDDPPGFWGWIIGIVVLFVLFLVLKSC